MSYFNDLFIENINKKNIKTIFELGSRDLIDTIRLYQYFEPLYIYAFECNPDCLIECEKNYNLLTPAEKQNIILIKKAISDVDGDVKFYPFDTAKYNNIGASSMLKIDFSLRLNNDPDFNKPNPQKEIIVNGTRLDTFMKQNNISSIDLLCIDLQGYELNALKSLGNELNKVKYIITECSIKNTYTNGATFIELNDYLKQFNFKYICSNFFGYNYPDLNMNGFSEFDALFIKDI